MMTPSTPPKPRTAVLGLALAALSLLSGCVFVRAAENPMKRTTLRASESARSDTVLVLLPGFGDDDETFNEEGFIAQVRKAAPHADLVATDAHFGYYREESLVPRLTEDVIRPLRAQGYEHVYLVGISIGGYGALGTARTHPELVDGVLLFAPYLGPGEVLEEVRDSGGLCSYEPRGSLETGNEGYARRNFMWLRSELCGVPEMPIYTAVGDSDDLAGALHYLTRHLPEDHSIVLPGGHGWEVWTPAASTLVSRALDAQPMNPAARRAALTRAPVKEAPAP